VPNNYRLQVPSGIQQSPNLKPGNLSQTLSSVSKTPTMQSSSTATSMPYMTTTPNVFYTRAPNGTLSIRPGQQPLIVNQNNQLMNLVPVNAQYQLMAYPTTLSVQQQDIPPPPTLSPNPTSDKSPNPTLKKKKPGKNKHDLHVLSLLISKFKMSQRANEKEWQFFCPRTLEKQAVSFYFFVESAHF
jgi:hypothetical protein